MSIVKQVSEELPKEGQVVYCDNGDFANDRATFEGGKFIGGGEFPSKEYEMKHVTKWFDFKEYCRESGSGLISFEEAEKI